MHQLDRVGSKRIVRSMSKVKTGLLIAGVVCVSGIAAGAIGAGAAIALVRQAYNGPVQDGHDHEFVVHSDLLGESVTLDIRLPRSYAADADEHFPVLWVLDGWSQTDHVAKTADVLAEVGLMPPVIVVAVPNSGAGRWQDFTPPGDEYGDRAGQADRFLAFLEAEAIPAVGAAFRVRSPRTLVGYSLSGFFVTYAMTQRPGLFEGRIAFSPSFWLGDEAIVDQLETLFSDRSTTGAASFFYASLGSDEGWEMAHAFEAAEEVFAAGAPAEFDWQLTVTPGADHGTNPELSAPKALQALGEYIERR